VVHKHHRAASGRFARKTSPSYREGRRVQSSIVRNGSVAAPTALTSHNSCAKRLVFDEFMIFGATLARLDYEGRVSLVFIPSLFSMSRAGGTAL
jgi:hypothetical protein